LKEFAFVSPVKLVRLHPGAGPASKELLVIGRLSDLS
jgi:hypothetical protein